MKKKKGFTLIELLAIIVILAIIAVITVPIILNIVDNAKEKAAVDSAYGYKDSIANSYLSSLLNDSDQVLNGTYTISNGNLNGNSIPFSGTAPTNGSLTYQNNKLVSGCLTIDGYKVQFQNGKFEASKGECSGIQETVLYYSYDSVYDGDYQTSKVPEPDSSWTFYVKETVQAGVNSYAMRYTFEEQIQQGGSFDTQSECEALMSTIIPTEYWEALEASCVEIEGKTIVETCGVEGGETFCINPNNYSASVDTLNDIFEGCNASTSNEYNLCTGQGETPLKALIDPYKTVVGYGVTTTSSNQVCVSQWGSGSCSNGMSW